MKLKLGIPEGNLKNATIDHPSVSSAASVRSQFDLLAPQRLTYKFFRFSPCLCASVVNQEPLQ
jgi:hypothetical protein